jgi:hypothetical protein
MNDVRRFIYATLGLLTTVIFFWVGFVYLNACGFTLTCKRGEQRVDRTPVPTLLPATLPVIEQSSDSPTVSDQCHVAAVDFIGAWVDSGASETDNFEFTDANGQNCESSFEEVRPLFVEANFWYSGSLSCVSCHSVDVTISPAQLDLSSYAGIMAGSRRADTESAGTNILGDDGNWESSLLYEFISTSHPEIPGHDEIASDLMIFVGTPLPAPEATATSAPTEAPTVTPTP